jgi:hypothetical protein
VTVENDNAMENHRRHYRHTFVLQQRLPAIVEVSGGRPSYGGEIVDLGVDGMRLYLADKATPLPIGERVLVRYTIPGVEDDLALAASVVYSQDEPDGRYYGLEFLGSLNPMTVEGRRDQIWRFLMAEQRRLLREQRDAVLQ